MKIIIIGPAYPYRGGIADTNESLARSMNQAGHDCEIMTFVAQYPGLLFPGKTQLASGDPPADLKISRSLHAFNPFSWSGTAREVLQHQADLVIIRYWTPYIAWSLGALAKRLKGKVKLLALVDNATPHEAGPIDHRLADRLLNRVDRIMCLSAYVADAMRKRYAVPVAHYLHPINSNLPTAMSKSDARKALNLAPDDKVLLFFGLVRKYKGLDILLEAIARLPHELSELKLVIAGEFYEKEEDYSNQIEKLGLTNRVLVHNQFIAQEDLSQFFSAADMLCASYRSASQSGVTQMAMHYDLPCLVTDVGALPEYVQHGVTGYVCAPDPIAITNCIQDYYAHDRAELMRANVSQAKHEYDWTKFTQAMLDLTAKEK